jgi:hypothetical protein
MFQAYINCGEENCKLLRQINNDDKGVKFNHKKRKCKNFSKNASYEKIDKVKNKLFKEYGKKSKEFLRIKLFRNPYIIKLLDCKFLTGENLESIAVIIYFDQLMDLLTLVDKKNV